MVKTNIKIYKLITSKQIIGIRYLKYQTPQKPEEEKLKSFAFWLNFLKLQLFHYFKHCQLENILDDRFYFLHSHNKSGVCSQLNLDQLSPLTVIYAPAGLKLFRNLKIRPTKADEGNWR